MDLIQDTEGSLTLNRSLYILLCKVMLLKLKYTCPKGMLGLALKGVGSIW